jgi:hypothetical protein
MSVLHPRHQRPRLRHAQDYTSRYSSRRFRRSLDRYGCLAQREAAKEQQNARLCSFHAANDCRSPWIPTRPNRCLCWAIDLLVGDSRRQ